MSKKKKKSKKSPFTITFDGNQESTQPIDLMEVADRINNEVSDIHSIKVTGPADPRLACTATLKVFFYKGRRPKKKNFLKSEAWKEIVDILRKSGYKRPQVSIEIGKTPIPKLDLNIDSHSSSD